MRVAKYERSNDRIYMYIDENGQLFEDMSTTQYERSNNMNIGKIINHGQITMSAEKIILQQEANGTKMVLSEDVLPRNLNGQNEKFKEAGFQFVGDKHHLFYNVIFPKGWTKQSPEPRFVYFIDENGNTRGQMFYKNTSYEQKADAFLYKRFYSICIPENDILLTNVERTDYKPYTKETKFYGVVIDRVTKKIIYQTEAFMNTNNDWDFNASVYKFADKWLAENYPKWDDVNAYWDLKI